MDPNENLAEQKRIATKIVNGIMGEDYDVSDVDRLAVLVLNLDEWINKGGFLPSRP